MISKLQDTPGTILQPDEVVATINEVIDTVNMILEMHPNLEERFKMKKDFERHMTGETPKDAYRANND